MGKYTIHGSYGIVFAEKPFKEIIDLDFQFFLLKHSRVAEAVGDSLGNFTEYESEVGLDRGPWYQSPGPRVT